MIYYTIYFDPRKKNGEKTYRKLLTNGRRHVIIHILTAKALWAILPAALFRFDTKK